MSTNNNGGSVRLLVAEAQAQELEKDRTMLAPVLSELENYGSFEDVVLPTIHYNMPPLIAPEPYHDRVKDNRPFYHKFDNKRNHKRTKPNKRRK